MVSIGLPVYNSADRIDGTIKSILAQQHGDIELVITDNASTDSTEDICRSWASADRRVAYYRQSANVGMLRNFEFALRAGKGTYFRWIGDGDRLDPSYVTRCLDAFAADRRLLLVTTQLAYTDARDGVVRVQRYEQAAPNTGINSDDPAERVAELLRLLSESYLLIDPLYGMFRRASVVALTPRRNMPREDEVFATRLAMAGPWHHINEVLAARPWAGKARGKLARHQSLPAWQGYCSAVLQSLETLHWARVQLAAGALSAEQYRKIRGETIRLYLRKHQKTLVRRLRKVALWAVGGGQRTV